MSSVIAWIAAEAEQPGMNGAGDELKSRRERRREEYLQDEKLMQSLPTHQFPANPVDTGGSQTVEDLQPEAIEDPEEERRRRIYRRRTIAMLRRYMRHSIETGRLPSLLGKEFFRAKVTAYTVVTFEDRVIFAHDMEKCLEKLDEFSRQVLTRVVLQEYEHEQAARLLGCTRMTVHRKLLEVLDQLSDILLEVGLLEVLDSTEKKTCQEGETTNFFASDWEQGK
jgi:RNA polymerase sigma factor (sigma-70 family)